MHIDRHAYLMGALAARHLLLRVQQDLRTRRQFDPALLRVEFDKLSLAGPCQYREGFTNAVCALVLLALEGITPNLETWDVLADVDRQYNN